MRTVSRAQAVAWRMSRHLLYDPAADLIEAVSRLAGVQAQVASCAELALGVRTSASPSDVRAALTDRELVRTWAMRGTLHLLPACEYATWIAALRTRVRTTYPPAFERNFGLTGEQAEAITAAIGEVLPGHEYTREELSAAVVEHLGDPVYGELLKVGWGSLLKPAAFTGALCSGPPRGQQVTFVSPRDWLPSPWREPSAEEGMAYVLRRFLDAYGPAAHTDFADWFGIQPGPARRLFAVHRDELVEVSFEGAPAYLTAAGAESLPSDEVRPADLPALLLPGFDPYVVAPRAQRNALIPDGFRDQVSRTAGWISPVLVADGRIAGVWSHTRTGSALDVTVTPFAPVPARVRKAAERHAREYARLLGGSLSVTWS